MIIALKYKTQRTKKIDTAISNPEGGKMIIALKYKIQRTKKIDRAISNPEGVK
jgi:hypothetical protein